MSNKPYMICPKCGGSGSEKGIYHDLACPLCHGIGRVDSKTGEAIPVAQAVLPMRKAINDLRQRLVASRKLNRELLDLLAENNIPVCDPYAQTGRYKGD